MFARYAIVYVRTTEKTSRKLCTTACWSISETSLGKLDRLNNIPKPLQPHLRFVIPQLLNSHRLCNTPLASEVAKHKPVFTSQRLAAEAHEPGKYVAKPVIVKVDGNHIVCVLPACYKIDLRKLKSQLGAESVELAQEDEIDNSEEPVNIESSMM